LTKDRETNFDLLGVDPGGRVLETSGGLMRMAQNRPLFAAVLAGSLALHVFALLILNLLERLPATPAEAATEIPVELVSEPAASQQKGAETGSQQSTNSVSSAKQRESSVPKPADRTKIAAAKPSQPPAAEKQAEAKPPRVMTPPKPEPSKQIQPEPPKQTVAQTEPPKPPPPSQSIAAPAQLRPNLRLAAAQPQPPAAAQTSAPSAMPSMAALQLQATPAPVLPSAVMDDPLLAVAVPKPSDEGDEAMSYKTVVFGMLELAKQFPPDARARGAHGTSLVYFELDDKGGVKTVRLLKSSGDTELDVESLAVVERAAPFPKPPPGAQKAFAADIEYDPNEP
jgi:periplasmic protein TonB